MMIVTDGFSRICSMSVHKINAACFTKKSMLNLIIKICFDVHSINRFSKNVKYGGTVPKNSKTKFKVSEFSNDGLNLADNEAEFVYVTRKLLLRSS